MGNCSSVEDKAEKERSDEIDRQIEEDSKKFRKECKILLLGTRNFHLALEFSKLISLQDLERAESRQL
jgi:hypothetical protein